DFQRACKWLILKHRLSISRRPKSVRFPGRNLFYTVIPDPIDSVGASLGSDHESPRDTKYPLGIHSAQQWSLCVSGNTTESVGFIFEALPPQRRRPCRRQNYD